MIPHSNVNVTNLISDTIWKKKNIYPLDTNYSITIQCRIDSLNKNGIALFISKYSDVNELKYDYVLGFCIPSEHDKYSYDSNTKILKLFIYNNNAYKIGYNNFYAFVCCANLNSTQFTDSRTGRSRWAGLGQPSNIIEIPTIK
ncbi:MAG: hypothetical protein NT007_07005 [Candidatus Kapabacteria bacterium]|nr:hypothetical protein [Candidatus Kapabacteria bacterium]